MRGPQPLPLSLSAAERAALEQLVRRHTSPQQLVLRARIVLAAAAGRNHRQIARDLNTEGVTEVVISASQVISYQQHLALNGFAPEDLASASQFGLTSRDLFRLVSILLIVVGIVGLRLTSNG